MGKNVEKNCPCCDRHCPADQLHCNRGREHFGLPLEEERGELARLLQKCLDSWQQ